MAFIDGILDINNISPVLHDQEHPVKAESSVTDRDDWVKKVKAEYRKHAKDGLPKELETLVFSLPNERLNSHTNRSYFVKSIAKYILNSQGKLKDWPKYEPEIIKLAVCAEMMITVQYYHNYIFDGKNGVNTPLMIRETLVKSNLLKSWLFRYIDKAGFNPNIIKSVRDNIDYAFNQTDIGQFIEGRYNSYEYYKLQSLENEYIDHYLFQDKKIDWDVINDCISISTESLVLSNAQHVFIKLYYLRLYLISTSLYQTFVNIILEILPDGSVSQPDLYKFSAYYGIMMQIVNDNIDFVPGFLGQDTKPKFAQDQQCDIKNKNITLPLFWFLQQQPSVNSNILKVLNGPKNKGYSERRELLVFEEILPVLVNHSIPIGQKIATRALSYVAGNSLLRELAAIATNNRFYKEIFIKTA
jgi:geranylgeranyl pyrophosphate synthase